MVPVAAAPDIRMERNRGLNYQNSLGVGRGGEGEGEN